MKLFNFVYALIYVNILEMKTTWCSFLQCVVSSRAFSCLMCALPVTFVALPVTFHALPVTFVALPVTFHALPVTFHPTLMCFLLLMVCDY